MTVHSTAFEHRAIRFPSSEAVKDAPRPCSAREGKADAGTTEKPATGKRDSLRKTLLTGAALALLAGAAWYGWNYWTVGQYLVSTDDAYVESRQHDDCAEGVGLSQQWCWWVTTSR